MDLQEARWGNRENSGCMPLCNRAENEAIVWGM